MSENSMEARFGKPIPAWLYCEETQQPFTNCTLCNISLEDTSYTVCKSFSRLSLESEPILSFEIAVCLSCSQNYSNHISDETKKALDALSRTYPKLKPSITADVILNGDTQLQKPTCAITNKPTEALYEYELSAFVSKNYVLGGANMIGEEAMKLMSDCLSDESSGFLDDFFNSLIDLPPEISVILRDKKLIF
ncbi:MAG: hypothetical protein AAF617_00745 [Bacteroidota bacterium]